MKIIFDDTKKIKKNKTLFLLIINRVNTLSFAFSIFGFLSFDSVVFIDVVCYCSKKKN